MAKSATQITKYKSAVTIVTADVANSWYGGLYGSSEASGLDAADPLVAGHVHDGQHLDGHAQKINLVSHVTDQLRNVNLGTDAVDKRTVNKFETQGDAIPEYEVIGSVTYYYLDLSILRSELGGSGPFQHVPLSDVIRYNTTVGPSNTTTDFVINSPTLDYTAGAPARMLFDVSSVAFRVGTTSGVAWDAANRGAGSFGWGVDTLSQGTLAFVGGSSNQVDATSGQASVLNGISNTIESSSMGAILAGGQFNAGGGKPRNLIGNGIDALSHWSVIVGGGSNSITGTYSGFMGTPQLSTLNNADDSAIVGGGTNAISSSSSSFIGAGQTNVIEESWSAIVSGQGNAIADNAQHGFIGAGEDNEVGDGSTNTRWSVIAGGNSNTTIGDYNIVVGGQTNAANVGTYNIIGGGQNHAITENSNIVESPAYNGIFSGLNNDIWGADWVVSGTIAAAGTGYAPLDILTVNGGTGSPATYVVLTVGGSGDITSVDLLSAGNYLVNPSVPTALNGGSGAGATINLTFGRSGSPQYSTIIGGNNNILGHGSYATIAAGQNNEIYVANHSAIVTGLNNEINGSGDQDAEPVYANFAVITGGEDNTIETSLQDGSSYALIGNGDRNLVVSSKHGTILNGANNTITKLLTFLPTPECTTIINGYYNEISGYTAYTLVGSGTSNTITGGVAGATFHSTILNGSNNDIEANSNYSTILNGHENIISKGGDHSLLFGLENQIAADHVFGFGNHGTAADPYTFYISGLAFDDTVVNTRGQAQYSVTVGRAQVVSPDSPVTIVSHSFNVDDMSLHVEVDYTCYMVSGSTERTTMGRYVAHVYDSSGAGTYTISNVAGATYQATGTLAGTLTPTLNYTGTSLSFRTEFSSASDLTSHVVATMKITRVWNDGTSG